MEDVLEQIRRAKAGDKDAFCRLVRRYQNLVYGYAFSLIGDFHRAQDIAQETFLVAYRKLPSLKQDSSFAPWLRAIAFRCCTRALRKRRRHELEFAEIDAPAESDTGSALETADSIFKALATLPDQQREAITLFYLRDYSQKEVADFLDVPESTVVNRLHKARATFKGR